MPRHTVKTREEARALYLTGEVSSVAEIARRLKVKPHTVGLWKREETVPARSSVRRCCGRWGAGTSWR